MEGILTKKQRHHAHYQRRLELADDFFLCQDGQVFKSLNDLLAGLKKMPSETFNFHANATRCDFADWIQKIIGDKTLAKAVERARRHQGHLAEILQQRLRYFETRESEVPQLESALMFYYFND